ncbi:TPA: glycosyltransferase family 61 protein [Photobacterium damselae]
MENQSCIDDIFVMNNAIVDNDYFVFNLDENKYHKYSVNEFLSNSTWCDRRIKYDSNLNFKHSDAHLLENNEILYFSSYAIPKITKDYSVFIYDYSWGGNYQHWLITSVSRLFIYFKLKEKIPDLKILHFNKSPKYKMEMLRLLGIEDDDVLYHDDVAKYNHVYIPRFNSVSGVNISTFAFSMYQKISKEVNFKYRGEFVKYKKIYLARNDKDGKRPLKNRKKLDYLLNKKGYKKLFLEDLTLEDKIFIFSNADEIIGDFSAGWSHCVFCKPNTKMILIEHDIFKFSKFYSEIAKKANCKLYSINSPGLFRFTYLSLLKILWRLTKTIDKNANSLKWSVNIKKVEKLL